MEEYINISRTFQPVYNDKSRILILGTFPSVKSRENHFYYGHPMNRFWKLLAVLTKTEQPVTTEEKKDFLLRNHIPIWDEIKSFSSLCYGHATISYVVPNDYTELLKKANKRKIYANGNKAHELYMKYVYSNTRRDIEKLPSTSPANAGYSLEKLKEKWKIILSELEKYSDN